ncbi:MAG: hypothetical protein AVDCRST_MAG73-3182, partial [uncultured Thermomicrobiales bacterium]
GAGAGVGRGPGGRGLGRNRGGRTGRPARDADALGRRDAGGVGLRAAGGGARAGAGTGAIHDPAGNAATGAHAPGDAGGVPRIRDAALHGGRRRGAADAGGDWDGNAGRGRGGGGRGGGRDPGRGLVRRAGGGRPFRPQRGTGAGGDLGLVAVDGGGTAGQRGGGRDAGAV